MMGNPADQGNMLLAMQGFAGFPAMMQPQAAINNGALPNMNGSEDAQMQMFG